MFLLVLALAWLPSVSNAQLSAMPAGSVGTAVLASTSSDRGLVDSLREWFGSGSSDPKLLPPDEAFESFAWITEK
ncbi:hypothetical protein GCM10027287_52560 [Bordetella muralis]